jgi:hypothetical protein
LKAVTILEPDGNITAETSAAVDKMRAGPKVRPWSWLIASGAAAVLAMLAWMFVTPKGLGTPLTTIENSVSLADAQAFQATLCAPAYGDFGPVRSPTRVLLQDFYRARYYPKWTVAPDRINSDAELRWLRNAHAVFPDCALLGFANGFEVGIFTRPIETKIDPTQTISDVVDALTKLAHVSEGANKSWCSPTGARPVRVRP